MRIALVDPASFTLPYTCFFANGLRECGHEVRLFCSRTRYNEELVDELAALHGAALPIERYRVSRTASPSRWRGVFEYARMIASIIRQLSRFDLVLLQFGIFLPLDLVLLLAARGKLVLTIHDDVPHGFAGQRHLPTWLLTRLARRLVFPSVAVRDRFVTRYGPPPKGQTVTVLQHCTLAATLASARQPEAPRDGDFAPVVTFFGNIKPYKGIDRLVHWVRQNPGVKVEIHGRWDDGMAALKSDATAAGVAVNDAFLSTGELDRLMRERRLFVLPYHAASQSGVLYLLLHYACPFVATASGDLGDFLRREGLQELIIADSSADALTHSLDHAQRHFADIEARLREVRQRYAWPRVIGDSPLFRSDR